MKFRAQTLQLRDLTLSLETFTLRSIATRARRLIDAAMAD